MRLRREVGSDYVGWRRLGGLVRVYVGITRMCWRIWRTVRGSWKTRMCTHVKCMLETTPSTHVLQFQ